MKTYAEIDENGNVKGTLTTQDKDIDTDKFIEISDVELLTISNKKRSGNKWVDIPVIAKPTTLITGKTDRELIILLMENVGLNISGE